MTRSAASMGRSISLGLVLALLALATLGGVSHASAATLSWGGPTGIDFHEGDYLDAVACPSSSQCTTVDFYGREFTFSPSQSGAGQGYVLDPGQTLNGVSCPSTTLCVTVDSDGHEFAFNPQSGSITRNADIDGDGYLDAVACMSTGECVTVAGSGADLTFNPESGAITADGDLGMAPNALSCPSAAVCVAVGQDGKEAAFTPSSGSVLHSGDLDGGNSLLSVTCPGTTVCIAGDEDGDEVSFDPTPGSGNFSITSDEYIDSGVDGYPGEFGGASCLSTSLCVLTDDDGNAFWINPSAANPTTSVYSVADFDDLQAVTCPTNQCVAVSLEGQAILFNSSGTVSNTVVVDPGAIMTGVACPSATSCTAVDDGGYEVTYDPAIPTQQSSYEIGSGLTNVACPSPAECVATDDNGDVLEFSPSSATSVTSRNVDSSGLQGLSCPSTTLCVASSDGGGQIIVFNPLTNATPYTASVDSVAIEALVCPTTSQCTGVDENGYEVTFNPNSSAVPPTVPLDSGSSAEGVSCATNALCVMVDQAGRAVAFDPQTGSIVSGANVDSVFELTSVSCPSVSLCEAVDYAGNVFQGSPSSPGSWTSSHLPSASALGVITCAPTSVCVVVDDVGYSYLGQGGTWFPAPGVQSAPTISGNMVAGSTLSESHGSWSYSPTSYSYQWEDCNTSGASCSPISGATGQSYTLTSSDVGHTVVVEETATNSTGSSQPSQSVPTGVVAPAAPSAGSPEASISAAGAPGAPTVALVSTKATGLNVVARVSCHGAGTCAGSLVMDSARGAKSLGSAGFSISAGQTVTVKIPISAAGLRMIGSAADYKLPVVIRLSGASGSLASAVVGYRRFAASAIGYQVGIGDAFSEIVALTARSLPKGTSVLVKCSGRGCPFGSKGVAAPKSSVSLSRLFAKAKLISAQVTVRLTASGYIGKVFEIDIPGGGRPADFKSLCAIPGGTSQKCH